jgi:hypothetical protein
VPCGTAPRCRWSRQAGRPAPGGATRRSTGPPPRPPPWAPPR